VPGGALPVTDRDASLRPKGLIGSRSWIRDQRRGSIGSSRLTGTGAHRDADGAERPPTFEYLRRVVEAAEAEGYYSLLIPTRFANGLFEETAPLAETWNDGDGGWQR